MSARYVFRSEWRLAASADEVYAALQDVAGYPAWWPQVRSVRQLDDETGEVRCRSLLPYDLVFAIRRDVEDPAARMLRARQTGDLEGWSQWSISAAAGGAIVVFDEDVVVRKRLVRRAGLLARPALRFNHAVMMRDGERGLRPPSRAGSLMDETTSAAYLDRIDATPPAAADADALRDLHRLHQLAVPFENLSIHLDEPISLDEADLVDKIVTRRRGGFCYELNGAFGLLLEALGFGVTRAAARVHMGGRLGPPFDHLALIVQPAGGTARWLADVGFGNHGVYPLRFDDRGEQDDPDGQFMLSDAAGDVDVHKDGQLQYRLEIRDRALDDFVPTCWWQQTSPLSHFTRGPVCSRLLDGGRISLSGRTLIRTRGTSRTEEQLPSDDAVLAAYREHFGIVLDRVPADPRAAQ